MNKNLITSSLIICSLYFSCSKALKSDNSPQAVVKIELLDGNGQTDTIGKTLASAIIVRVNQNGTPTSGYSVQFVASGCGQTDTTSTLSQPNGTAYFNWPLAGNVGPQTLKAYVLNSKNKKIDSVTVTATGLQPASGWHNSACSLQGSSSATSLCKLSTGRLFACYNSEKTFLRYSDDNGVSWYAVKSLGNTHTITDVFSNSSDELFVLTEGNDGLFYSNNAGQTWSNSGVPPFNTELFTSAVCTRSGKLMVTTGPSPAVYISNDKGKTWTTIPNSAFVPVNNTGPIFNDPDEDIDGNLYVVEQQNENIFKSTDGGNTWSLIPETGPLLPGTDFSFYIDNNNNFYKNATRLHAGIYMSNDKGNSYNEIIPVSLVAEIENMSVQSDGNFYYEDITTGLYSFDGTTVKLLYPYGGTFVQPYIVAKNNNIIFANEGHGGTRYYNK